MKTSELIIILQDAIDKYGDLPVVSYDAESGDILEGWHCFGSDGYNSKWSDIGMSGDIIQICLNPQHS